MALPRIPQFQTTLSHVAPDKAAEIRSAVTGALMYTKNGMFSFEQSVETTFVLPWDLNPKVEPQKLSKDARDGIRGQLLDSSALEHLEGCGAINWNYVVLWQCRPAHGGEWIYIDDHIKEHLEIGYMSSHMDWQFSIFPHQFRVSFSVSKLMNTSTQELYEIRRLAFSPLMPLLTEADNCSLFHASSLGFWGIHDRTLLMRQAVMHTLSDPKAQITLYDRWSDEIARLSNPPGAKPVGIQFAQWEAAKQNLVGGPQLHLFTLSNVVQRPIIVYTHPESSVGGIYLPLLWEGVGGVFPCDSHPHLKNPLVLGYDCNRNHFVPLVTFKGNKGPNPILLPLTYANGTLLRIHYLSDSQIKDPTTILSKLMFIDVISHSFSTQQQIPLFSQNRAVLHVGSAFGGGPTPIFGKPITPVSPSHPAPLACVLNITELPEVIDQLIKRYQSVFL